MELYEKYGELDKKYKEEENEKEIMNKEFIEAKKLDEEKQIKIINKYENITKQLKLELDNKNDNIKNLSNEINKIEQSYVLTLSKNKELDKKLTISDNINKKNQNILTQETKNLLKEQGFDTGQMNNKKINEIIKQLINDKKQNQILKKQINILDNYYEQIKKNYEEKYNIMELEKKTVLKEYPVYLEKIEFLEKENSKLKNINNINLEKMNSIQEEKNSLQKSFTKLRRVETEKNKLANEIFSLKQKNSQLISRNNDIENKYQTEVRKYENSKIPSNHSNHLENIRLISAINFNEKLLNNSIKLMNNDLELFNKFKKESKGIDAIIENDIPSLTENNYDIVVKKAKYQIDKIENLLEHVDNEKNLNDKNKLKNRTFIENITKLNEIMKTYKENYINIILIMLKSFNKLTNICSINNNNIKEDKINSLKKKSLSKEKQSKNKILELILTTIDKFKPLCYYTDNSDLKIEINKIQNNSEKLTNFELMQNITDILQKIILRSSEYRINKEKEIKNLNGKIAYLIREVDNYKKYYDNHKTSDLDEEKRLLNNQLFLQDGEINRLNKENDKLLKTIADLMNNNEDINIKPNDE